MAGEKKNFFLIHYRDAKDGSVVMIKAKSISDSSLGLSFISISDFMFETKGVVVNPTEEQMAKRFENVQKLHLSIYSILSIEEIGIENSGLSFSNDKSNLVVFPNNSPS